MQKWLWNSARKVRSRQDSNGRQRSLPRLEQLEGRTMLTAYYVSSFGNDANTGLSPRRAFKTITRVNQLNLEPGDSVSFQAGATFNGNLFLSVVDSGTPTNPITITSYGQGHATIFAGNDAAIFTSAVEGIHINRLNLVGSGMFANSSTGIHLFNPRTDGTTLDHMYVDDVEVSGFGSSGLLIEAAYGNGYFRDVRITNSTFHHNRNGGIQSIGPGGASTGFFYPTIFELYIGHCTIYDNAGVTLGGVDGAVVERTLSYNTTDWGTIVGGGFVVYNSSNVTLQYNEAYNVKSFGIEGAGFALDWGTVNCVMQYNYSHDNDGAGFVLFGSPGFGLPDSYGHTVRYNVSENDARVHTYGGITIYLGVYNADIYNNTVFMKPRPGVSYSAFQLWEWSGTSVHVRNNIFSTTGGVPLVVNFTPTGSGADLLFQGNTYYSGGSQFLLYHYDVPYLSLSEWRSATGQEKYNGNPTGSSADPQLTSPGNGGTIGNADRLNSLSAYKLKSTSPVKNAGLNLSALFGINPGPRDYFENLIPSGGGFSVGAHDIA